MKKIINTFKYGSSKTKLVLLLTIIAGLATLGFGIVAIVTRQIFLFFCVLIGVFLTICLAQTFAIKEQESTGASNEQLNSVKKRNEGKMLDVESLHEGTVVKEENSSPMEDSVQNANAVQVNEVAQDEEVAPSDSMMSEEADSPSDMFFKMFQGDDSFVKSDESLGDDYDEDEENSEYQEQDDEPEAVADKTGKRRSFKLSFIKNIFSGKHKIEEQEAEEVQESDDNSDDLYVDNLEEQDAVSKARLIRERIESGLELDDSIEEELSSLLDEDDEEEEEVKELTEDIVNAYDKRKIKKVFHKYKVKRDHRMVLVDHSNTLRTKQTPAYVWVNDNKFNILLIEQEPRHITIPVFKLREVKYLKKQPANEDIDYAPIKGNSLFADMFKPYLPDYTHSTVVDDLTSYKNLYGIAPDIYFTNRSAANIFDLLGAQFMVDDKVTMSPKVNIYFKDTYKANILLRDNVIDANGYADRISSILDSMAKSTISYNEFKDTLNLMIKNKLITQEFAMYYMEVRDKNSR